jgi:regulator of cell morphogenesis and NO signaling
MKGAGYDRRHMPAARAGRTLDLFGGTMTATLDTSVRDIVAEDFRAAAVFQRFGIDFCCGGRRTLREACDDKTVSALDVLMEVNEACDRKDANVPQFADWPADALIAYIVGHHHGYVKRVLPAIVAHARKVAESHGASEPELNEIAAIFAEVADEMTSHMAKEEGILFPYITKLAVAVRVGEAMPRAPFGSVEKPIAMMEHDHESAGQAMARIRKLSKDYALPEGACTTYTVCFRELEEFERDLHVHVHLENNVLFPKARTLGASAQPIGVPSNAA